jgi:RAB protein geranylgeranyltransferase component A
MAAETTPLGDAFLEETVFDAVVIGTGFCESVLSAALCRVGRKVLHIDKNDFYGGACSTHGVAAYARILGVATDRHHDHDQLTGNAWDRVELGSPESDFRWIRDAQVVVHDAARAKDERRYSIDTGPALLYARGATVDALVKSGVARYLEFRAVESCLMACEPATAAPVAIPHSKAALFADASLALSEKRMLMKFLQAAVAQDGEGVTAAAAPVVNVHQDRSFRELIHEAPFNVSSAKVEQYLTHGIALAATSGSESISAEEAMHRIGLYAKSIGHYGGQTPFIAPMYGTSEIPQAFCRESAVYGATFMLRTAATSVALVADRHLEVALAGIQLARPVQAKWVAISADLIPRMPCVRESYSQRCVVIVSTPIVSGHSAITFIIVPPGERGPVVSAVHITQYDFAVGAATEGHFVVHFSMAGDASVRDSLRSVVESFVDITPPTDDSLTSSKPKAIWCSFHTHVARDVPAAETPVGITVCPTPNEAVDFASAFTRVEAEFRRICGDSETFLPAMPNPEDIVWQETEPQANQPDPQLQPQTGSEPQKPQESSQSQSLSL